MKIYYDPNAEPGQAPVVEPVVIVEPVVETTPKSKEDWQKLSQDNPQRWIELTQQNMDRIVRESRETKEQLDRERQEKQNLIQEVNKYKQPAPFVPDGQTYTVTNPPKNQAEWDTLFIESPKYAADLNNAINSQRVSVDIEFKRAFGNAAREVQTEHPDMYVPEVDSTGQVLRDGNGKPIIKKTADGSPIYDPNSEKGKLWEQIYKDSRRPDGTNPLDYAPNAPTLMMAELERRLVKRGQAIVNGTATPTRQNQIVGQGVLPPTPSAKVKFSSEGEKSHAEKAVQRGTYKSLEEFCQVRDSGERGFYDENRRPDFSRK